MELRKDEMMPMERLKALLSGQLPDRVLVWLWGGSSGFAARNIGYPLSLTETDPEKSFQAQLRTAEMYGSDNIPLASFGGSCRDTWVFGGQIKMPTGKYEQAPSVVRYPVESEEDARQLKLPGDLKTAGPLPLDMQFSRLQERAGLPITVVCSSPIEAVRGLCGVDKLFRWIIKQPELVHQLMREAVGYSLAVVGHWVDTFGPERILVMTATPSSSNQVVSPKQFETFVLPYQRELHGKVLEMGIKHIYCHICGEQNMNLPYWAQIPMGDPGIVSFGHEVDLTTAIKYFGETCVIAGNIEPAVIQTGTPQQVYELCRKAIEKAKQAPRGFILMPGCGLPPMAPPYNVFMMKKAVSNFGWYTSQPGSKSVEPAKNPGRDSMTPVERVTALLNGKKIDRVPLYPFILGFCARNTGYPLDTIYKDPERSFEAQMWTQEQYGFDWGPVYGYASYGTWEFGGEIEMPESDYEQAPTHTVFPVQSEDDVGRLKLPDVTKAGCLPLAMEFSRLQARQGTPITLVFGGNFTIAGNICPVEKLCRWMLKEPQLVHRILRMATDHIVDAVKHWADTFGGERVIAQIWEPLASNEIISPAQFQKFVLPYLQESGEKILGMGIKHIFYHICGEQNLNLPYWAQVPMGNPGICSVGSQIEIATAIKHLGDKAIIAGNIEPALIHTAQPQQVYELCRKAIEDGKKAPRGYMLMSGCEIPPDTPPYNVHMMRKALDDFGRYE